MLVKFDAFTRIQGGMAGQTGAKRGVPEDLADFIGEQHLTISCGASNLLRLTRPKLMDTGRLAGRATPATCQSP